MPLRTFLSAYPLTGGLLLLTQLVLWCSLFPETAAQSWSSLVQFSSHNFSALPTPLQGLLTTFAVATGILVLLLAGFLIDILHPLPNALECWALAGQVDASRGWLDELVEKWNGYVTREEIEDATAVAKADKRDRHWKSLLPWRAKPEKSLKLKLDEMERAIRILRRLHALLIARIVILPANTRLELFGDEYYFWHASRAVSSILLIATIETVGVLLIRAGRQTWVSPAIAVPAVGPLVLAIFMVEIAGLVLSTWLARRAYKAFCVGLFAMNFAILRDQKTK